jgi:hypothetical protein
MDDEKRIRERVRDDRRRPRFAAGEIAQRRHDRDFDAEQHDCGAPGARVDWGKLSDHDRLRMAMFVA